MLSKNDYQLSNITDENNSQEIATQQNKIHIKISMNQEIEKNFTQSDYKILDVSNKEGNHKIKEQLNQIFRKLELLEEDLWEDYGNKFFKYKKFGKIKDKSEAIWFGYYNYKDYAQHTNFNYSIRDHGLDIDVNAELSKSFKRFIKNINEHPEKFDKIIGAIDWKPTVDIYTKLPLLPESANKFYWKKQYSFLEQISAQKIIDSVNQIKNDFHTIRRTMINEVENNSKYSEKDTQYVKSTYLRKQAKNMRPFSFCVLRIHWEIKKNLVCKMGHKEILKKFKEITKRGYKLMEFANK